MKMKRRRFNQEVETNSKRASSRKTLVAITATVAICLSFAQAAMAATATGTVDFNTVYQQLEGFGGAIVYDATTLDSYSNKNAIYDLLFRDLGIEFVRIRNCVGYDDSSVTATKAIIAAANARRPVKLELVPWSPPSSYKSGGTVDGGTLKENANDTNDSAPYYYEYTAYAQWWANSLTTWATEPNGLTPDYISIQNEPDWQSTGYDTCRFDPNENSSNAGYNQAFEHVYQNLYSTMGPNMPKMLAPETMGITGGTVGGAEPYIKALIDVNHAYGFSHHLYSDGDGTYSNPDSKIPAMQGFEANDINLYGDKPLYMTEYSENPNFTDTIYTAWHIYNALVYEKVTAYFYWSLFRAGSPITSTSPGGVVSLNTSTSTYVIRPTYYALKHYTAFTGANWYRAGASTSDTNDLRITAFKNPSDTNMAIVIVNVSISTDVNLSLSLGGFSPLTSEIYQTTSDANFAYLGTFSESSPLSLPNQSITTIHLTGPPPQYSDCNAVIAAGYRLASDLNGDCYVNFEDLAVFVSYWLSTDCTAPDNCHGADFAPTDGTVDFFDFSDFALQWMQCNDPQNSTCIKNW
jgi:O-glycosyl hydrolase